MPIDCSWKDAFECARICIVMEHHKTGTFDALLDGARFNFKKGDGRRSLMVYGYNDYDTTGLKKLKEDSEKNGGYLEVLPTVKMRKILNGVKNHYEALGRFYK